MELINRPRRLRQNDSIRRLCRETRLSPDSLIYPIFVDETLKGKRPIPALDGGQILFVLVGAVYRLITRKTLDQKVLGYINMVGFVCLMGLMVVVAVSDVRKFIL